MRDEVAVPSPRDEFDGIRKFDGRGRVYGSPDGVGTYFGRGFGLWRDIDAELQGVGAFAFSLTVEVGRNRMRRIWLVGAD